MEPQAERPTGEAPAEPRQHAERHPAAEALLRQALQRAAELRRLPESTYRLQFHAGFTFADASAVAPYLARLGVTHCYASPYLRATPGSTHGYDVIDHCSINPELGGEPGWRAWLDTLRHNKLHHILDIVPNHVGIATNDNTWWNDVLANGPSSAYGSYFDIAWRGSPRPELHDKVLLPVLGGPYGQVLENGELTLQQHEGRTWVVYYDRCFPIDPATVQQSDVHALNGTKGDPRSFDRLDQLLNRQHYRLAYWQNASDEINYRRFFDVNGLAALAMERQEVFEATHPLILRMLAAGDCAGLRIDHPDGLFDPAQYHLRLQRHFIIECARAIHDADAASAPNDWSSIKASLLALLDDRTLQQVCTDPPWPLYVVAEKILAMGEPLPQDWAVHGTSGYDFLNIANGLFVDRSAEEPFTRLYEHFTGDFTPFAELVYQKKKLILETSLASELHMLAHRLDRIAQQSRRTRDFTLNGLRRALAETIACFPVYRSYICETGHCESDRTQIDIAVDRAAQRNPRTDASVFHFIRDTLLSDAQFAGKFQQLTSPVTAKGVEDTAFYCYHRLVSLNEVGGEPDHFGVTPDEVHRYLQDRQQTWPHALSALSTHDTKRSEDVRARINVLSEMPDEWRERVLRWRELNAPHRRSLDHPAPAPDEEYLLYQILLGAGPIEPVAESEFSAFVARVQAYMTKAMREAKLRTSWTAPNEAHETAVKQFIATISTPRAPPPSLTTFGRSSNASASWGLINSLSQTLLKIAAPGVPDTYQGTEMWDFSLVDPDNRRPVDYPRRAAALDEIDRRLGAGETLEALAAELLRCKEDGRVKMFVTSRALRARQAHAPLFSRG